MNAVMYIVKTGCQCRMLPKDLPPYNTVFYYYSKWKFECALEELTGAVHRMVRRRMGQDPPPASASMITEASSPLIISARTAGLTGTGESKVAENISRSIHLGFR